MDTSIPSCWIVSAKKWTPVGTHSLGHRRLRAGHSAHALDRRAGAIALHLRMELVCGRWTLFSRIMHAPSHKDKTASNLHIYHQPPPPAGHSATCLAAVCDAVSTLALNLSMAPIPTGVSSILLQLSGSTPARDSLPALCWIMKHRRCSGSLLQIALPRPHGALNRSLRWCGFASHREDGKSVSETSLLGQDATLDYPKGLAVGPTS
jgi:hypothetical protein